MYFSHSRNGDSQNGHPQPVALHLKRVAELAKLFGDSFGAGQQAEATAILHDLGKYSTQFQRRLFDAGEPSRDHWSLGAAAALAKNNPVRLMPAAAIAGHHVGLGSVVSMKEIRNRVNEILATGSALTTPDLASQQAAITAFQSDGFALPSFDCGLAPTHHRAADMLDTRMLFSALVDADFLATEGHFAGDAEVAYQPRLPGQELDAGKMQQRVLSLLETLAKTTDADQDLLNFRSRLMADCANAGATLPSGAFTLTAPTGAGKTLAMLRFAIEQAIKHSMRRIILVMPYINIVQQTASIYRDLFPEEEFGDSYILESHSLAGRGTDQPDQDDAVNPRELRRRLLSQNWDAPVVLTTNVGLLESLHANRPSRCRKLHRLARSVILFDEAQTLPPNLAKLTLATLSRLADPDGPYRSSVVFATATQPAFEALSDSLRDFSLPQVSQSAPVWRPREIVRDAKGLFKGCGGRVRLTWRDQAPISIESLAGELLTHQQVAVIVNLKRHAHELTNAMLNQAGHDKDSSIIHLSTSLSAAHRSDHLAIVRQRLDQGQPVRLVSTQCIEAGVDVDFPVLYRAFAPLDSIAQAAGRCNRNGRHPTSDVIVFELDDPDRRSNHPLGYGEGIQATKLFVQNLRQTSPDVLSGVLSDSEQLRSYFRQLYSVTGRDSGQVSGEQKLHDAVRITDFAAVAKHYRLINDDVINVLVPYEKQMQQYEQLLKEGLSDRPMSPRAIRRWQARASHHAVSVYRTALDKDASHLLPITFGRNEDRLHTGQIDWWYPCDLDSYSDAFGLRFEEETWVV